MFSNYVSPRIVEELIKDPGKAKLGGQCKELTMLFSDVRGFTTFCEQLPPEEVVPLLNEYLTAMIDVVFYWNGTLDKFVGDAVVAFWGRSTSRTTWSWPSSARFTCAGGLASYRKTGRRAGSHSLTTASESIRARCWSALSGPRASKWTTP